MLKFYILNMDSNTHKPYMMNIFNNLYVRERSLLARNEYNKNPDKFSYYNFNGTYSYGYEAFRQEINSILRHEFWSRYQYEFYITNTKIDGYFQCESNLDIICRIILNSTEKE